MMEAARTSETLVNFYQTTQCYNPEDSNLHALWVNDSEFFAICSQVHVIMSVGQVIYGLASV
jgi:hypothetical protein